MLAHVSEKAKSFGKKISLNMLCYYISGDHLQGVVFVWLQLSCNSPVEVAYYSASHITRQDICCYCAATEDAERDQESLKTHRVVLPICKSCKHADKPVIKRLPRKKWLWRLSPKLQCFGSFDFIVLLKQVSVILYLSWRSLVKHRRKKAMY